MIEYVFVKPNSNGTASQYMFLNHMLGVMTKPRGFYLRTLFTEYLVRRYILGVSDAEWGCHPNNSNEL